MSLGEEKGMGVLLVAILRGFAGILAPYVHTGERISV
jgi:hypothetical protein